jgi:hypothetical protein
MSKEIKKLESRIKQVKSKLLNLGELRPGSLVHQFNVCGKKNCSCKDPRNPRKHGPYHLAIYSRNGRRQSTFIQSHYLPSVRREIKNYQRLRSLVDEWVGLALELSVLRMKETRPDVSK